MKLRGLLRREENLESRAKAAGESVTEGSSRWSSALAACESPGRIIFYFSFLLLFSLLFFYLGGF